jgi:2-methylcitrate dehydratase
MYPAGHARNTTANLRGILTKKAALLGALASDNAQPIIDRFNTIASLSTADLASLHTFTIADRGRFE